MMANGTYNLDNPKKGTHVVKCPVDSGYFGFFDRDMYLGRQAVIGFAASATSDSISNPIRVLKTYRQTSTEKISYTEAAKAIIAKEGFGGFWTRGLSTKIVANGLQGVMFSVGYKYFTELIFSKN